MVNNSRPNPVPIRANGSYLLLTPKGRGVNLIYISSDSLLDGSRFLKNPKISEVF